MGKPDCYKCKYRGEVPGDAHSSCHHPAFKEVLDNGMMQILSMLGAAGRVEPFQVAAKAVKVVGNEHGKRNGWFNHPLNFDPVWLEECTGFKKRKKTER